jgi:DnaK suppressor protein
MRRQAARRTKTTTVGQADRRQRLSERRNQIQDEMWRSLRAGRTSRPTDVGDELEHSDADIQGELDVALLQMRAEALARINETLRRFDAGEYGSCVECGDEIADRRLRALPFAVRCRACEERREREQGRARQLAERNGRLSLFSRVASS